MLEQLYTRKVIFALMAVIFAANGWLLYQLWYTPPTVETADAPTSETPQAPATPPEDEATGENEDEEENGSENESSADEDAPTEGADEPPVGAVEGGSAVEPSSEVEGIGDGLEPGEPQGEAPEAPAPAIPFSSQYGPQPTEPGPAGGGSESGSPGFGSSESASAGFDPGVSGAPGSGGDGSGVASIQMVVMSALFDIGNDGPEEAASGGGSGAGAEMLPTTSGFGVIPAVLAVGAVFGAAVFIIRRR